MMTDREWFRNEEWNSEIEAHFYEKLRGSRDKSQYLRIQAGYLAKNNPEISLALLDKYFELGEHFDKAQAYVDQANAYIALGRRQQAILSYQAALIREQEYPNLKTDAWSQYALLVATEKESELYEHALTILMNYEPTSTSFPIDVFCWFASFAILSETIGENDRARKAAFKALDVSELRHSGYRYHPTVGLVGKEYDIIRTELRRLISDSPSNVRQ
jgi:tetratricopeptide (TPR) repeat protein